MNIVVAMLLASLSRLAGKVWGPELIDKALTEVVMYCLDKWVELTPNKRDDAFRDFVRSRLDAPESPVTGAHDERLF